MLYWVIYDISENKVRSRVASKCKNYGFERIQKSAFMGDITKNKAEMLSIEIGETIKGTKDCVFIIPSCNSCFGSKIIHGNFDEEKVKAKDFVIISG